MSTPGYVTLHRYDAKTKQHEPYHALVLSSRQIERKDDPVLTVAYFDHRNTAAHHALNGVDWAHTIKREFDVPSREDAEGAPMYYEDTIGELQDTVGQYVQFCKFRDGVIEELKAKLANTTEGRDERLQELAHGRAKKVLQVTSPEGAPLPRGTQVPETGPIVTTSKVVTGEELKTLPPEEQATAEPVPSRSFRIVPSESNPDGAPSVADLDAVAEEQKAKEATA